MTEYDYSPDAYERYMVKMQSIGRWVDDTQRQPPANPHLPPTPHMPRPLNLDYPSMQRPRDPSSSYRHRSTSHSSPVRTAPIRSQTMPPQGAGYGLSYPHPHQSAPIYSSRQPSPLSTQNYYGPHAGYSSHHQRSPSNPNSSMSSVTLVRPTPKRSNTYMYATQSMQPASYQPVRSTTLPTGYNPYQAAYYQYPSGSQTRVASPVQMHASHPVYPVVYNGAQKQQQPLYRKVFGFLGTKSTKSRRNHSRRSSL